MKHLKIIIIACMFTQVICKGQNYSREYDKIGKDELELISYKSAEAVILFDIGKSYFQQTEEDFKVVFEETKRIKILSEAGIKWAEVEIPYYNENQLFERVYDIEACTFNPENGVFNRTLFDAANTHDEKINDHWTNKKFALPDVKVGSIIQYKYKIVSDYKFNFRDWEFQSRIPTIYSEFEARMIPFYEYVWLLQGASKFDSNTTYTSKEISRRFASTEFQDIVYSFVMKNVPAFNDEEYISSINDYLIKIDFQLTRINSPTGQKIEVLSTWPELVRNMLKDADVTKFASRCEKLAGKLINPDSLSNKTQYQKFNTILNFVKSNFSWNENDGKYASKSPGELINDKFGNAADLNLLTIGLLNSAGIEASPVLISTRENGKIKNDYPYLKFFNYLLINAKIDGKDVLSDATEIFCPNDRIPSRCINDKGLLIKEGNVQWVNLKSNITSEIQTSITIDSIGKTSTSNLLILASEYDGLRFRNNYGEDKKKIAERSDNNIFTIDESSIVVGNQSKKEDPYVLSLKSTYRTDIVNNKIYLSPFLDETISENPLKQNDRTYPIDLIYPRKRSFKTIIKIPEGYKVEYVPVKDSINNNSFALKYMIEYDEKVINVTFNYTFKKSVYDPSEYHNLKFYFGDIIKKGNDKIVLVHI